ncbi:conserved unknown protein [Ectocarpus siliculosus]|uniref:Mitochondrial carrier protein n=1 Tax=Ectocarpus siliculosus TaxID=2880 RepID=D8LS61_ECTSI|nr:conserved unknown protein [Ectocarpus siliculosus]|eukprot:CBN75118.1 conserved unknown protein [Ectocarpus siliculosus]
MDPSDERQTVDWEDLDKKRFYSYGITFFMGVRALLYPPFLLKTKIQVARGGASEKSAFQVARATVREEGVRGLYKGFWISSTSLVFRQVYFTTYEVVRHHLGPGSDLYQRLGPEKGELVRNMSAGAASSAVMQCFTVPLDIIGQVYGESGLRGFYRGFGISVLQFAPTSAIWWAAYGVYSRAFVRALGNLPEPVPELTAQQRQVGGQAAAGFCTGMTTVLLTNPLDVLRTRLQVEGRRGDDRTIASEYRILMAESGPRGLMKGLGPRILAMAPASVLIVSVYELIKRLSRKTPLPPPPAGTPQLPSQPPATARTAAFATTTVTDPNHR